MARVNITVPDQILERAKAANLNVSRVAAAALAEELDRLTKLAELEAYLNELQAELGPVTPQERAAAKEWADRVAPATAAGHATGARSA